MQTPPRHDVTRGRSHALLSAVYRLLAPDVLVPGTQVG
jgi:hypothetical protein